MTIDPTLTDRYPADLFDEKADRAREFPEAHLLPEGFVSDSTINSVRENVGLEEKYAEALDAIEKDGLPGKTSERIHPSISSGDRPEWLG